VTRLSGTAQSLSASINITCAWDYRFSLGKSLIQGDPRVDPAQPDKFVIPYEVNPPNAKIEIQATKNIVSWTIDTANRKITLTPKGEGEATLMVTAVNGANGTKFSTQNCALNLAYSSLTLQPSLVSVNGRFSRYNGESGVITLGDGEDVTVKLGVKEINTNYTLSNVKITKTTGSSLTLPLTPKEEGMWNIKHPEDVKENVYTVYHDIIFYYNGNPITVNKWNLVTLKDEAGNETQYYVSKTNITETRTVSNFKKTESKQVWVSEGTSGHNVTQYTAVYENGSCTSNILLVAEGVNKITSAIVLTRIERDYTSTNIQASITREYTSFIGPVTWSREPIEPKPVPVTEFDANPKWRVPLVGGGSYLINDSAQYDVSPDTAVKSSKVEGYLEGSIVHNGTSQAFQIPIVVETRKCPSGSSN
jgi:hypothetical protein